MFQSFLAATIEMTMLLVLLLVSLQVAHSQTQEPACPAKVTALFNRQAAQVELLFEAIRQIESKGDQCKINETRIGPYQLSEQYYAEAAAHDERLKIGGTYEHSYVCSACTIRVFSSSFLLASYI